MSPQIPMDPCSPFTLSALTVTKALHDTLVEAHRTGLYGRTLAETAVTFLSRGAREFLRDERDALLRATTFERIERMFEKNPRADLPVGQRRAQVARRKRATRRR